MIARMDQIMVVSRRRKIEELITSLQSLGVIHIDPLESTEENLEQYQLRGQEKLDKEKLDRLITRSEAILKSFAYQAKDFKQVKQKVDPKEQEDYLNAIGQQVDTLVAEKAENRDELELAELYLPSFRELTPLLAQFEDSKYLAAKAFYLSSDKSESVIASLKEQLADNISFAQKDKGKESLMIAVVAKESLATLKSALSSLGIAEINLPERYAKQGISKATHTMEERLQTLPARQKEIDAELAKLSDQHAEKVAAALVSLKNRSLKYEKYEDMVTGKYGAALKGWLPSIETSRVLESLKKQFGDDISVSSRPADDHHDVNIPVKFDNPNWVKPFEGLLGLFAPPKYGAFDPSWTLAVFFPLFFGMIMGDIGFGLMFAALAYWMMKRGKQGNELVIGFMGLTISPEALKTIAKVIFWAAAWAIIFGFAFGEFFGNFLEQWPAVNPIFYIPGEMHHGKASHGIIPILIPRTVKFNPMLLMSIAFGTLQIVGGWLIRAYYGFKHKHMSHFYEGVGMTSGLIALVLFATTYLMKNASPFSNTIVMAGFAIFLLMTVLAKMPLMLVELISNGGNILSYLRIFAVGLSAALIANLATDLGFAISGSMPVIGPILGIVIALIVHLLAVVLTILGHALQPLRLNYVEFFTKFGFYDESGVKYNPFRLLGGK